MYNSASNTKKQKSNPGYLVRPKSTMAKPFYLSLDKKKKCKKFNGTKMEFRKKPDYTDTAYREAVSRLRILLAESYTPLKRPLRELDSAGEETDNQSLVSSNRSGSRLGHRQYYHYLTMLPRRYNYYPPLRHTSDLPLTSDKNESFRPTTKFDSPSSVPPELMSFIEKQEDYIEQLEKESRFCRGELSSLLNKVRDVISENENLHEKQKNNLMRSVFNHLETETETETDLELNQKLTLAPSKHLQKSPVLEGPAIVFESRISELEAQLTQAKIDLRKALEENNTFKKKIADGNFLDGINFDSYKSKMDNLQREKDLLQDTVTKLQAALTKIRTKENDTCDQVQRSLNVAEQAQYEKNAAELEIRRLKDELERQHTKLRDLVTEQNRRVQDECTAVERRYTQQVEQLTAELGAQWESTNKLQLELDKQRRENSDLRREVAQKQAMLNELKNDMQNRIMNLRSDIGVSGAEKSALEQQIATLQMANERNERQSKQEIARLQVEMQSLRQRLDRADADLIHSKRENVRLTEQIASLEKEINLKDALSKREKSDSSEGQILALPAPKKEQELTSLIEDMESKHAVTVAELEGMIHSQNQLMDKLSNECHTLTQKLEDASVRHKEEIRELQTNLDLLSNRFNQSQITSSNLQDEDHNPNSYERTAPHQATNIAPFQPKPLSRTNSKTSSRPPSVISSRKNSQSLPVTQPSPTNQQYVPSAEQTSDQNYENYNPEYNYETDPQYMTQEQYEQQYGVNPDQQYAVDSNQYVTDPSAEQYALDSNQHYNVDPNQQYITDPNQQYSADPNQQYASDPPQMYTSPDPNQNSGQTYVSDPNQNSSKQFANNSQK